MKEQFAVKILEYCKTGLQVIRNATLSQNYNHIIIAENVCLRATPVSKHLTINEIKDNVILGEYARIRKSIPSGVYFLNIYIGSDSFTYCIVPGSYASITYGSISGEAVTLQTPLDKGDFFNLSLSHDLTFSFEFLEKIVEVGSYLNEEYNYIMIKL